MMIGKKEAPAANQGINDADELDHKVTKKTVVIPSLEEIENGFAELQDVPFYNQYKIDLDEELSAPPVAMAIKQTNGGTVTLFTKGNFSIITGAAKSRKSFFLSMLMAEAVSQRSEYFQCPSTGINILFDTEQAKYKVQQIGKRVSQLAGSNDNLDVYTLRTLDPAERIALIEKVLKDTANINFVAIDGIIDLDNDPILQAEQAQKIIQNLMKWSEDYGIHICCVLHYNKTITTLLGHLGSFAHRKADAIISVTKDKNNENISIVEAVDTREKPFESFAFSVDENGLPFIMRERIIEEATGKKSLQPIDIPPF